MPGFSPPCGARALEGYWIFQSGLGTKTPWELPRSSMRAAAAGQCDVAVANTYYYGRLASSDKEADREVASALGVFWPNQADRGAHINVSGAGITLHAKHPEAAEQLLEFLVNAESQTWYAEVNNEYPVVSDAQTSALLKSFGTFKSDSLNLSRLGENNRAAVQLMDRAGWR